MFTPAQYRNIFIFLTLIILALGYFIFSSKAKVAPTVMHEASASSVSTPNYVDVAEERRRQELDIQADSKLQEKRVAAKKNSVECQFWLQQQAKKTNDKIEEKVAKFCNLSTDGTPSAATSDATSQNATQQ